MRKKKDIDVINDFLLNKIKDERNQKMEEEEQNISFTLSEEGSHIHYCASEYNIANWILNSLDMIVWLMDDIEMDDETRMHVFSKRMDVIKEQVDKIYFRINKHE